MNRKLFVGLVPLLAVAALAVVPAAAQAAPHWYKKGMLLGPTPVTVVTAGTLKFSALGSKIKCEVSDAEEIWNPTTGGPGEDRFVAFTLSACKAKKGTAACPPGTASVTANGLPWRSVLLAGPPIRDEILNVKIQLTCSSGVADEFEGTLTPEVGIGVLVFGGVGGGTLFDALLNPMTVTGKDKLKAPPGMITAL